MLHGVRPLPSIPIHAAALSLLLAGCGGAATTLEASVAEDLAQRADAVAQALEAGDGCTALQRTSELEDATTSAREAGDVTDTVAAEVLTATRSIAQSTSCEPPPAEDPDDDGEGGEESREDEDAKDDDEKDEKDDDKKDEKKDEGRGRGGGDD